MMMFMLSLDRPSCTAPASAASVPAVCLNERALRWAATLIEQGAHMSHLLL